VLAPETPQTKVAVEFATLLGDREFQRAHGLLAPALRARTSAADLERSFTEMTSYGEGPPTMLAAVTTLQDWPDKQPGDLEWVYVAVANDTYSEAITVVVAAEGPGRVIRSIEWGRP
jgi:uncharacterized protein YfaS (alpha-2-macroglobulin family)